jgi:circadian clock protein KaiB
MRHPQKVKFRLYVAGDTQNSAQALANLREICEMHLPNSHEIEIVDVFREQSRALEDRVFMTPTLVKLSPSPMQRIVGTLSQASALLQILGLESFAA